LIQHPDIYISKKKEPNFFLYDQGAIIETTGQVNSLEYYQHFFQKKPSKVTNEKALGEASVAYLCDEKAPYRIQAMIPDLKLIAILRNPIDRAYSQYLFFLRQEIETEQNFPKALKGKYSEVYIKHGFYGKYLPTYFELFPASQIKIILFEDFIQSTLKVVQEIYRFLEVDDRFIADVSGKDAVSGIPHNQKLYNFVRKPNIIKTAIKSLVKPFIPATKRRALWTKAVEKTLKKPKMTLEDRQKLLEIYREDILILQDLINKDLSHWLRIT
jgi:hypothetical protein